MNDAAAVESRRSFVGGSDIAKIIGMSPWGDAFSLFLEKTGQIPENSEETAIQRRGRILEPAIAQLATENEGIDIVDGDIVRSETHPWKRAQIDRYERTKNDGLVPFEIKSVGEYAPRYLWGPAGTDVCPAWLCAQLHWQISLANAPYGRMYAMLGLDDVRIYTLQRDPEIEAFLHKQAEEFWQRVQDVNAPEPNFDHPQLTDALRRAFHRVNAEEIIQADDEMHAWRHVMQDSIKTIKIYEGVRNGAKAHFLHAMRDAALIDFGDGEMLRRQEVNRAGYEVGPTHYVDLRLIKPRKKGQAQIEDNSEE